MSEKRRDIREPATLRVEYTFVKEGSASPLSVEAKGTIIDISDNGFCLETYYPLRRGDIITLKDGEKKGLPLCGLVRWTKGDKGIYRIGLFYQQKPLKKNS
jgi:hypothetical protein